VSGQKSGGQLSAAKSPAANCARPKVRRLKLGDQMSYIQVEHHFTQSIVTCETAFPKQAANRVLFPSDLYECRASGRQCFPDLYDVLEALQLTLIVS
jgi:hypothetical protein